MNLKYTFTTKGIAPFVLLVAQIPMLVWLIFGVVPLWLGLLPTLIVGTIWMLLFLWIIIKAL